MDRTTVYWGNAIIMAGGACLGVWFAWKYRPRQSPPSPRPAAFLFALTAVGMCSLEAWRDAVRALGGHFSVGVVPGLVTLLFVASGAWADYEALRARWLREPGNATVKPYVRALYGVSALLAGAGAVVCLVAYRRSDDAAFLVRALLVATLAVALAINWGMLLLELFLTRRWASHKALRAD